MQVVANKEKSILFSLELFQPLLTLKAAQDNYVPLIQLADSEEHWRTLVCGLWQAALIDIKSEGDCSDADFRGELARRSFQ